MAVTNHGGIILSLFLAGLLGSFSHCAAMCGPFVMAQVSANPQHNGNASVLQRIKGLSLLPYHAGRITTYVLLGIMGASFSQFLVGTPIQRNVAFVLLSAAGILFIINAVPTIKKMLRRRSSKRRGIGVNRWIGKGIARAARPLFASDAPAYRYALGLALGFLPCGLVIAAVMAVAATGEPIAATLSMAAFGVGTIPALFLVGTGTQFITARWPTEMRNIAAGVMAINGASLVILAGGMIF